LNELIHKRKWDSKVFDTGRIDDKERSIYGTKLQNGLHDIEPDGSFVECDVKFMPYSIGVSTDKVVRSRCGEVRVSDTASESKDLIKIKTKKQCGISLKLKGHRTYGPHFDTLKDTYYSTNDGITLRYYPNYKGVNIIIEIANPQTALNKYRFSIKEYGCTYEYVKTDEGIHCISSTGEDDIHIKALYAIDAKESYGEVSIDLIGIVDGLMVIEKIVNPIWLGNAVGPVKVDPSVTIEDGVGGGVIVESMMNAGVVNANYGARVNMNCTDYTPTRVNWAIRTVLTGHGIGTVTLAEYRLNCDQITGGGGFNCNLWPILRQWNEGTQNGAGEVGSICAAAARFSQENWTTNNARNAGTDYDNTTATGSFTAPVGTGAYTVTLDNSIIQARVDGGTDYGDVCHNVTDTSSKSFRTETSESGNKPQLYIEYTEGVGGEFPFFFDAGHY
jgi:hypothetical protein